MIQMYVLWWAGWKRIDRYVDLFTKERHLVSGSYSAELSVDIRQLAMYVYLVRTDSYHGGGCETDERSRYNIRIDVCLYVRQRRTSSQCMLGTGLVYYVW